MDFELVLHRPIEATRITGHLRTGPEMSGERVCQEKCAMFPARMTPVVEIPHEDSDATDLPH